MNNDTFLSNFFNESYIHYSNNDRCKRIFEEAHKYFGDKLTIGFLSKIIKNELLASYIISSTSRKYLSLETALENNNSPEDSILIYVEELDLYMIFDTIINYASFCGNLCNPFQDIKIEFMPYQIVPTNIRQKVVFSIRGSTEEKEHIKKYAEEYFKSELYEFKNGNDEEITMMMDLVENYDESVKFVDELYEFVSKKKMKLAKNIIKLYVYSEKNNNYTMSLIYYNENPNTKKLTINDIVRNSNFSIIPQKIINKNIEANYKESISKTEEKRIFAIEWIKKNPPIDKEKKQDYFNRFCKSTNNKIRQGSFNDYVKSFIDVEEVRINDIRKWAYIK